MRSVFCLVGEAEPCVVCSYGWSPLRSLLEEALGEDRLRGGCVLCREQRPEGGAFLHGRCYLAWEGRRELARRGVEALVTALRDAPQAALVRDDGLVAVTVNIGHPAGGERAPSWRPALHLYETGEHLEMAAHEWGPWLAQGGAPAGAFDAGAFDRARARLRAVLPTMESIVGLVDWRSKREQLLADAALRAEEVARLEASFARRRQAFERACALAAEQGLSCPRCGAADVRVVDAREPHQASYFVCRRCGRSWAPEVG